MMIDGQPVTTDEGGGQLVDSLSLSTSWSIDGAPIGQIRAVPTILLVPLYHKIRIPFERVQAAVIQFDALLDLFRNAGVLPYPERPLWDIRLTDVNQFKRSILADSSIGLTVKSATLLRSLPRFIWRATATIARTKLLDLLFDATDIEQGQFFVQPVEYDPTTSVVLRAVAESPSGLPPLTQEVRAILGRFRNP